MTGAQHMYAIGGENRWQNPCWGHGSAGVRRTLRLLVYDCILYGVEIERHMSFQVVLAEHDSFYKLERREKVQSMRWIFLTVSKSPAGSDTPTGFDLPF